MNRFKLSAISWERNRYIFIGRSSERENAREGEEAEEFVLLENCSFENLETTVAIQLYQYNSCINTGGGVTEIRW